jgi:uncharacterized membrane protein YgcG
MNEKLYEALEVCLNALETGADIEAVLNLYPQLADELRPLLEASVQARSLALPAVPEAVMQRGRARVLQRAVELRKAAPKPRRRWSMFAFPRLATSLAIALIFLLSGTGLVSASNGALPGDSLYPVKRSWEDLRLFFIFSPEKRVGLESEFEQKRLDEISALLTEGRKETIAFAGLVTAQNSQDWQVSGITVMLTSSSRLPADTVSVGAPVMVIGHTNAQGLVEVDTLETLGPGASLPPLEPSQMEASDTEEQQNQGNAVNGNQQPEQLGNTTYDFQGVVESKNGNIWTINGQPVNVEFAENKSPVSTGVLVEFEGYYSVDGQFIATKIEVKSSGLFKKEPLNSNGKNIGDNKSNDGGNSGGDSNSSNSGSSGSGDSHDGSGDD